MRKTIRAGLLLALLMTSSISGWADGEVPDRSNAFGYAFTQEELDSFPQKTNLPTVYLQVYKTSYDATTDKTSFVLDGEGKAQLEDLWTVFGDKHEWYYLTKIVIRDDFGTIKERNEWLGVRGRGNSTWYNEGSWNKPLRLKFNKKADLLTRMENGEEVNEYATDKNWTLLANHYDATRIRNALAIELEKRMGMAFCPAYKFVDLVVNNKYMGTYQISDHVNITDHRVPIDKKTGYFLEGNVDDRFGRFQENPYIKVPFGDEGESFNFLMNVKNPEPDKAYEEPQYDDNNKLKESEDPQYDALKEKLTMVAQLLYEGSPSWRKFVDFKSAVDAFLVTEISGNYDGAYANNYFYMANIDSKIVFSPLWDLDLTWNYNVENYIKDQHFWQYKESPFGKLCEKAWNDPFFMKAVYERWQELKNDGLETFLQQKASELKELISQSADLNFKPEWENGVYVGGAGNSLNPSDWADKNNYSNLEEAYTVMNDFIPDRTAKLQEQFEAQYIALGCANAQCTDHDYADCAFAQQTDGTYRRVCNICSEAETNGDVYYYFTVYPESSASEGLYATSWHPSNEHPNAIAIVKITPGLENSIVGWNIVNATKNDAGDKVSADFRLVDGHPFFSDDKFVATQATYSRTVGNTWGTMMLPFKFQQAVTDDASFYHIGSTEIGSDNTVTLVMTPIDPSVEGNASAYVPVVFMRANDNVETVTVTGQNVTVKKSSTKEKSHTWGDWTLTGVVESTTFKVTDEANADKDFYYISKDEFWHATGKLTTKPFRAYLSTVRSVGARSLRIALADEPSAVKELSIDNCLALFGGHGELTVVAPRMMGISISTLGGMVVRRAVLQAGERLNVQLPKGVYVVNGVKVIVK